MVSTATYTTPQETGTPSSSTPSIETSTTTPSTSTGDLVPPARPTSLSTAVTSESPGSVTSSGGSGMCPTGFYACSAVYQGGCCQTGRDCDTTSCPAITTRTAVSDGKTIVVPSPTLTGDSGRCAQGWFSCADTAGGGCCPTGFACGSSCAATAGSTTIAKTPPESAGRRQEEKMVWVVLMVLIAMIMNA